MADRVARPRSDENALKFASPRAVHILGPVRRSGLLLSIALLGCQRRPVAPAAPPAPGLSIDLAPGSVDAGAAAPVTATETPSEARCGWQWPAESALEIAAAPEAVTAFDVACTGRALVAFWHRGATLTAASRSLSADSAWGDAVEISREASAMGTSLGAAQGAWVAYESPGPTLRVASLRNDVLRRSDPVQLGRVAAIQPMVLWAQDNLAVVAVTLAERGHERVLIARVSTDGQIPAAGAVLGDGVAVAVHPGARAWVAVATAERHERGAAGPWSLTGWRIDPRLAGAFGASIRAGQFGALPPDAATRLGSLTLGHGRFEVSPYASASGAVLYQTVLGAERGMARLAWVGEGAPSRVDLRTAPSALAGVFERDPDTVEARYWDEQNTLVSRLISRTEAAPPRPLDAPLADAPAVLARAQGTRTVLCGGTRWRLSLSTTRANEPARLEAAREDCLDARAARADGGRD